MRPTVRTDCEGFHRRDFLRLGTAGLFGLGLADLLRLEARADRAKRKATSVIMIWLAGAPATIDMWDLKPDAPEGIRGEFKPIATSAEGVRISDQLPKLAKVMDRCALVRSLHHNIPEHGVGTLYVTTGNRPSPALDYPALGSLASRLLPVPTGVPSYVTFSGFRSTGPGYLGSAYSAFEVEGNPQQGKLRVQGISLPENFTTTDLNNRDKLRNKFDAAFKALDQAEVSASLDKFHQQALDILRSDKTRKAFNLDEEKAPLRDGYGRTPFGQSALAARRLVEAGARFVTIGLGGWDTHANNFRTLRGQLLPQLDQTLSALVGDLDARGLLDSTLVYCAGEFGRTPTINGSAGRDHWARAMAVFLAGAGIRKGYVHGSTDAHGMQPASDPCSPDDVSATIFRALGIAPNHEVQTTTGRPIAIFREGKVLDKLLE
ncbi:MAG TPA: DUF1501 domain-containing protein [Gemmataceae bacterium]|nr:DUF1501 domain-containing protein [Gemmataceae bacterium]